MRPSRPSQPVMTALHLGQLLRQARKSRNLTQAAVAGRVGLSQNRLSFLELHPEHISMEQLLAWLGAVGLELHVDARDSSQTTAAPAEW